MVLLRGAALELTRLEFDLLVFLCRNPNQVHDRATLMTQVWKLPGQPTSRTIDVHVRRLRRKLDGLNLLTTVRGVGYRAEGVDRVRIEDNVRTPLPLVRAG